MFAVCPFEVKNGQIIAAQSADTLLNIEGVRVSFVLWPVDEGVGISARSNGDVNVQRAEIYRTLGYANGVN